MEEIPPSYTEATSRDAWVLIAPHLSAPDLFSACLVSKSWNQTFTKFLWGDPASHFIPAKKAGLLDRESHFEFISEKTGLDPDYFRLISDKSGLDQAFPFSRFLNCVRCTRPHVRELTYTIDLSKTSSSFCASDVPPRWLLMVMSSLPNVKSILASDLAALDEDSVSETFLVNQRELKAGLLWTYDLRLLDLRGSQKLKPDNLRCLIAEGFWSNLIYFGLSASSWCRDRDSGRSARAWKEDISDVFRHYIPGYLRSLEVLRFRGMGVTDADIEEFAKRMGTRLWSLDLSDNEISDASVAHSVDYCTQPPDYPASDEEFSIRTTGSGSRHTKEVDPIVEDQAWYIARKIKDGYLASNPSRYAGKGLTHLYISGNDISADGVIRLLRCSNLRVLDVGRQRSRASPPFSEEVMGLLETCKLTSILNDPCTRKLSCLRIHHRFITGATILKSLAGCPMELMDSYPTPHQMASRLGSLPRLILSDVPHMSAEVTRALQDFLHGCRKLEHDTWLAQTQHVTTDEENAGTRKHQSSCLAILQLEMARREGKTSMSITEDLDSDIFLRRSRQDYSFFASKAATVDEDDEDIDDHQLDVIDNLTSSRKKSRYSHNFATKKGIAEPGKYMWSGTVKIVR
ncbi:MAG: hypothetical protein M1816_001978 [Peltula sp. TS41687]|nr:MAG: hypothetical protein M1816_001978 [Peltula sp. TS41687]